ncbi:hypothetical protein GCM10010102_34720 [Promicromonospora citrea]|uniref:Uncharacterized protein n=1 Tax=Promicromonospora citrea TaxID=43677 RepID=A0A8H9GKX8_9MICO|nr:hypothetical protein GCM10010102_34720 [Promicromonospora citrea]
MTAKQTNQAVAAVRHDSYASTTVNRSSAAEDYRIKIYGENQRSIPIGTNAKGKVAHAHPDGFTSQYGAVGDAKHIGTTTNSYILDTLPKFLRGYAVGQVPGSGVAVGDPCTVSITEILAGPGAGDTTIATTPGHTCGAPSIGAQRTTSDQRQLDGRRITRPIPIGSFPPTHRMSAGR